MLIEAFHYRFHSVIRDAEALVRAGALGGSAARARSFNVNIARSPTSCAGARDLGGGGLMDLGCYPIHALRTLIGERAARALGDGEFEGRVDTRITAELEFPGGAPATVGCAMSPRRSARR